MPDHSQFAGIDYGSRMAGTTVICWQSGNQLQFLQSEKKQDADAMVLQWMAENTPAFVTIDAPLSLPGAYFRKGQDYFFRECDRQTGAMSPMFLGGLTARAMQLAAQLRHHGIACYETYPGFLLRQLFDAYDGKFNLARMNQRLMDVLPLQWKQMPENKHQFDATLAWLSAYRRDGNTARALGNPSEGLIWI